MNNETSLDAASETTKPGWERSFIENLAMEALREQRLRRRWGIFFKTIFLLLVIFGFYLFSDLGSGEMGNLGRHTALIEINGAIESE